MMDILIVTSSGDLMFFTPNGTALKDKFFEVRVNFNKGNKHDFFMQ